MDTKQSADTTKRTYTVEEIANLLGVSKSSAYHLINSNQFHSVKIGGQHRVSKKVFDEWLDGNKGGSE